MECYKVDYNDNLAVAARVAPPVMVAGRAPSSDTGGCPGIFPDSYATPWDSGIIGADQSFCLLKIAPPVIGQANSRKLWL
jgi:hypothetical protein